MLFLSSFLFYNASREKVDVSTPFILKNMDVINLEKLNLFSFHLITFATQLPYVSVTVKKNFTSKLKTTNRLKIPKEGVLLNQENVKVIQ